MAPVIIGVILWFVALVVLLVFRQQLADAGTSWWFGACAVGLISGLVGIAYLRYRRRREGGAGR